MEEVKSIRSSLLAWCRQEYGDKPLYLWEGLPGNAVLRHAASGRWYALFMLVPASVLGLPGKETIDILDVHCDFRTQPFLLKEKGIFPAYHMSRRSWITLLLDGTLPADRVLELLRESHDMTLDRADLAGNTAGSQQNGSAAGQKTPIDTDAPVWQDEQIPKRPNSIQFSGSEEDAIPVFPKTGIFGRRWEAGSTVQGDPGKRLAAGSTVQGDPGRRWEAGFTIQGDPGRRWEAGSTVQGDPGRRLEADSTVQGNPARHRMLIPDSDRFSSNRIDPSSGPTVYQDEKLPVSGPVPEPVVLPQKLKDMKSMFSVFSFSGRPDAAFFYRQGTFVADYTDDYVFRGRFNRSFPVYYSMTNEQLRGYFGFRTRLRAGEYDPVPPLAFIYLYVYELINGIGVTPQEGFEALKKVHDHYAGQNLALQTDLEAWQRDYIVYYNLDGEAAAGLFKSDLSDALEILSTEGTPSGTSASGFAHKDDGETAVSDPDNSQNPAPAQEDTDAQAEEAANARLFQAVCSCSAYALEKSPLYKKDPALVRAVICRAYRELAAWLPKNRGNTVFEYCFGRRGVYPYSLFRSAVFYDHLQYEDYVYDATPLCRFRCRRGSWLREAYAKNPGKSKELGALCQEADRLLREKTGFGHPLQEKALEEPVRLIIEQATSVELLNRKRAEEAARRPVIRIDMSRLDNIRRDAAITRDSLIVETEGPVQSSPSVTEGADSVKTFSSVTDETDSVNAFSSAAEEADSVKAFSSATDKVDSAQAFSSATDKVDSAQAFPSVTDEADSMRTLYTETPSLPHDSAVSGKLPDAPGLLSAQKPLEAGRLPSALTAPDVQNPPPPENLPPAREPAAAGAPIGREEPGSDSPPLSPDEHFLLHALLYGHPWRDYVREHRLMLSMLADGINECLLEQIGDTVLEFDGDEPRLVEDYIEDLKDLIPVSSP